MLGLSWPELLVIALVGFFVFGPEQLPGKAREFARMVRRLRDMAQDATEDLRSQLPSGSDLGFDDLRDLRDLHPRRLVGSLLIDDRTEPPPQQAPAPAVPPEIHLLPAGAVPPFDLDAT